MGNKKIVASIVFLFSAWSCLYAQDECELTLTRATGEFNAGHLYGIPGMLSECFETNHNSEWRQRAYLLLAETYLLLEDPLGAENSYLNVLYANPEYLTDEKRDPIDLVYLSKKFTASPLFSFHALIGPNISPARLIYDVRIDGESQTRQTYKLKLGFQLGAGMDYNYNEQLSVSAGIKYVFTGFQHVTTDLFGSNKDMVEFLDRQTWATVPLTVKYSDYIGKFRPYGYVGYSFTYLLRDKGILRVFNRDSKMGSIEELTSSNNETPNLNLSDHRTKLNGSVLFGGGVKYKYNLNFFFVDLQYGFGLKNITNTKNRFSNYAGGLPYPYVDDDFRMDNLAISVGYIHPFYKPRKLKKTRTNSVLRKIKKHSNATK